LVNGCNSIPEVFAEAYCCWGISWKTYFAPPFKRSIAGLFRAICPLSPSTRTFSQCWDDLSVNI
jgi:hypothetical protein